MGPRRKDLAGQVIGRLTVVSYAGSVTRKCGTPTATWLCRCECGTERVFTRDGLRSTRSCGCLRREHGRNTIGNALKARHAGWRADTVPRPRKRKQQPVEDLTGKVFSRWTVVERAAANVNGAAAWNVRCQCGSTGVRRGTDLRGKRTLSCGCLLRELHTKRLKKARRGPDGRLIVSPGRFALKGGLQHRAKWTTNIRLDLYSADPRARQNELDRLELLARLVTWRHSTAFARYEAEARRDG